MGFALSEGSTYPKAVCSCTNNQISPSLLQPVPSFVGNDYFCDTGIVTYLLHTLYPNDPSGMVRAVGPAVPAAPSTLLRGSLKLSLPR